MQEYIESRTIQPAAGTPRVSTAERVLLIFQGGLILYVFLRFARVGLRADFTNDDMLNLYQAWEKPILRLVKENLLFFSSGYRPLGALAYRFLFAVGGLNALPFRIAVYVLLIVNLYLLYRVARDITTREIGILTALLLCFNASFAELYYNTGTIYDVLCFTFYFAALGLYIGVRKNHRLLTTRQWIAFLVLNICALNSKEMAVTLPAVLLIYELVLGRSELRDAAPSARIGLRRWMPPASSAAIALPYIFGKLSSSSPLIGNESYRLHISVATYFSALAHYFQILAQAPGALSAGTCAALLLLLLAAALLAPERCLLFALLFTLITPLPVLFVPVRGAYAMYIPAFGIALYLAATLVFVRDRLLSGRVPKKPAGRIALEAATFLLCLAGLFRYHRFHSLNPAAESGIRPLIVQLDNLRTRMPAPARILFLDDPFSNHEWTPVFVCRLYYRNRNVVADQIKMMGYTPDQQQIDSYDVIFTYGKTGYTRVKPPG